MIVREWDQNPKQSRKALVIWLKHKGLLLQPVQLHGSFGRDAATGRGTVFATRELLKASGLGSLQDKTFVIQVASSYDVLGGSILDPRIRLTQPGFHELNG